jgi:hypothetical protein
MMKVSHILKQLKINLLDMDAARLRVAVRPSNAQLDRGQAWRAFVKSAATIYKVCLFFSFTFACIPCIQPFQSTSDTCHSLRVLALQLRYFVK